VQPKVQFQTTFQFPPISAQSSEWALSLFTHHSEAYYAKILVLPWNQSWDYSFESLPMLTVLEDKSNFRDC
jgi:hypothetical protein